MSVGTTWLLAVALTVVSVPWMIRDVRRAPRLPARRGLRVLWEPRDLWVGVFRDPAKRRTYICVVPCVVLLLEPRDAASSPSDGERKS